VIAVGRRPDVFDELEARGIKTSTDLDRLADMELIFRCLPDGRAVADILFGELALLHMGQKPDKQELQATADVIHRFSCCIDWMGKSFSKARNQRGDK
jgi:hypothetical protein